MTLDDYYKMVQGKHLGEWPRLTMKVGTGHEVTGRFFKQLPVVNLAYDVELLVDNVDGAPIRPRVERVSFTMVGAMAVNSVKVEPPRDDAHTVPELFDIVRGLKAEEMPVVVVSQAVPEPHYGKLLAITRAPMNTYQDRYNFRISDGEDWYNVSTYDTKTKMIEVDPTWRRPGSRAVAEQCPRCGDAGEWRCMALVCRNGHGPFIGGAR